MPGRKSQRRRVLVLDRTKLAEQDLILTMLSQSGEQVRAVAKGARKPGSRLAARTELCCDVDVLLSQGRGLAIVSEAQVVDAHKGVRGELDRLACASAMCEVARVTSYEDVEDPFLFALLGRALRAVEEADGPEHLNVAYAAYALKVLSHAGWRPVLSECVACGEASASRLSVRAGGVLCASCARDVEGARPVDATQLGWLRALVGSTFDVLMSAPTDLGTSEFVLLVAHEWASVHLDARLRASEFFAGL